jgi:hypothetical protein
MGPGDHTPGYTRSVYETADTGRERALVVVVGEREGTFMEETIIWNPEMDGLENFLSIVNLYNEGKDCE